MYTMRMTCLYALAPAQPAAVERLQQARRRGRLHHAYLVVGGSVAARAQLLEAAATSWTCTAPEATCGPACGRCDGCRSHAGRRHPDIHRVGDGEHPVDVAAIRALGQRLGLRPALGTLKVVLLDATAGLLAAAQNALLKALEEPPGDTIFLLAAPQPRRLLATVRSRCCVLRLRSPGPAAAAAALQRAGVPAAMAPLMAPRFADDSAAAVAAVPGAAQAWTHLHGALQPQAPIDAVLAAAAELGADKQTCATALDLLEVWLRDALARRFGAPPQHLVGAAGGLLPAAGALAAAAAELRRQRRRQAFNVNRTLALEAILLTLADGGSAAGQRP